MVAGRILLAVVVLFFFSMWKSCGEFSYMMSSEETTASRTDIYETGGGRRSSPRDKVNYQFKVDGKVFAGAYTVPAGEGIMEIAKGELIVQYQTGDPTRNRPADESGMFWVILFFIFLAAAVFFGIKTWNEADGDLKRAKGR